MGMTGRMGKAEWTRKKVENEIKKVTKDQIREGSLIFIQSVIKSYRKVREKGSSIIQFPFWKDQSDCSPEKRLK